MNTNTKKNYPRVGKQDREAQIFEDGNVVTSVKRTKATYNTQIKCSEKLKEV